MQARKRLKESRCGFVLGMPMVCTREEEVQPSPTCSLDTDFCPAMAGDMVRPRLGAASKCGHRSDWGDDGLRINGGEENVVELETKVR